MSVGAIRAAALEDWLRERYFTAKIDISSSGMPSLGLGELRALLDLPWADLDAVAFRDSPSTGCATLRAAVADRYAPGRADDVVITHGASEAIFLALAALVREGDEVVVLEPVYQSLSSIAEALGARCRTWRLDAAGGFRPDLDRLAGLLGPRTRAVVLNFPHNPTGASLGRAQRERLDALLAGCGAHLLWDASMADLTYTAERLPDPAVALPRGISVGTLSKAYGLPGLRVGWCVAPHSLVDAMLRVRDYTTISTSPLTEHLAERVLRDPERLLAPARAQAAANRATLLAWVARHASRVDCPAPVGGVTAFPRFLDVRDTRPLCTELADRHGVLTVPGDCFGHPDRMRIGFGGPADELAEGLDVLSAVLDGHG